MYHLTDPISVIPKVGPKYKLLLNKLEIYTIEDLLYHFPFRYDDFSKIKTISELIEGEEVTIEVKVNSINNVFTRNGKKLTKAVVSDFTGKLEVLWFNQQYVTNMIEKGENYYFSGKVSKYKEKLSFISPEFEPVKKEDGVGDSEKKLNTGRLVPIYPETAGVSSKYIRNKINDILSKETNLKEFIPAIILENENLQSINWSINQIHFPESEFEVSLARDRFIFEELFLELLKIEDRRSKWNEKLIGIKMKEHKKKIEELIRSLPFELTKEQNSSIVDISIDMNQGHPMNRLIEGDVGTGKTMIAIVAAYITYLNKYKTLYMAPTEILAKQHFATFKRFLPELNIKILTGSLKDKDLHEADIIIGTHAIIFTKEELQNVGLVIIDEQHRFGVEQRGKILDMGKKDGKTPHFLSMTATPIPRTLALTMYGDLDISILKEHPNKLRKISTKVIPENKRNEMYEWIKEKNEQTFIVCPLIEESESGALEDVKAAENEFYSLKTGIFKGIPMGLLHGKMKPREKEEIITKFRNKEIHILVATPVIEVGIDVPDAAVIVIESAERYGLASLHQLRGRVGRGEKEGFCFLSMSNNSKSSYERLKNVEKINNGLELAEIDMKIRGIGDVFGTMQHGYKKFKIASFSDTEMVEKAQRWAKNMYPNLDNHPLLKDKLNTINSDYIKNN